MARPEDLIYSVHVGTVQDYLTGNGGENMNSFRDLMEVPYQRIVQVQMPGGEEIRDEAYFRDAEARPSWMGGPLAPADRTIRVNNKLLGDVVDIMDTRRAIDLVQTKLGATALVPEMAKNMELLPKGARPAFGQWAIFGLQAGGKRYELSRIAGGEDRAHEFLNLTSDGSFGIVNVGRTGELHKLLRNRVTRMLTRCGHGQSFLPGFVDVGYYMPKAQARKTAA